MSALTVADIVNTVPLGAPVPDGFIVFPIPATLGWLIVVGFLAVACAAVAVLSARGPVWAGARRLTQARRVRPRRRQPQPS